MSDILSVYARNNGADLEWVDKATGTVVMAMRASKVLEIAGAAASSAIGSLLPLVAHAKYDFAVDGGAVSTITPASTATLPDNAIMIGGVVNSTTAVTSGGSATVAIGTSAGSSTTAILGATAKASLGADVLVNAVPVFATPVKLTAAGSITFTIGTAALTAGVIEVFVLYVLPQA